jgi:hypothetical protein
LKPFLPRSIFPTVSLVAPPKLASAYWLSGGADTSNRKRLQGTPIKAPVPSSHIYASYLTDSLAGRFALGVLNRTEIDLWGVSDDLTAIALKRRRNTRLNLGTKLANCEKKTGSYVNW